MVLDLFVLDEQSALCTISRITEAMSSGVIDAAGNRLLGTTGLYLLLIAVPGLCFLL